MPAIASILHPKDQSPSRRRASANESRDGLCSALALSKDAVTSRT
ncbi:14386_t:CDS:1, partial [Dentiscutata erythropus]